MKEHATQIDSVIELSNGDIAVSGGPINFEVIVYRPTEQRNGKFAFNRIDSIGTGGEPV